MASPVTFDRPAAGQILRLLKRRPRDRKEPRAIWPEIAAGTTAAVLTIPVSMGYGLLTLYALGDAYVPYGLLAGLYSAIFVPLVALLLGTRTAIMYAPRSIVAFLLSAIVLQDVARSRKPVVDPGDVYGTLTVVFFIVLAAGLLQFLFGAFRLGVLVKYIPSPVMAGFQNAAAVSIFVSQLGALLGLPRSVLPSQILAHVDAVQLPTLAVGIVTGLTMWYGPRVTRRMPNAILALTVGTLTYYMFVGLGFGGQLGRTVGSMPLTVPAPIYASGFLTLLTGPGAMPLVGRLAIIAFSLALICTLDGLLAVKTVEGMTGQRTDGNRELMRLGLGNMVTACFGGMSCGVNLAASSANYRAGGRTGLSVLTSALVLLLGVLALAPVIGYLPRVVIAGILLVVALQLVDQWSVQLLRKMLRRQFVHWQSMALDLFVIVTVATVAVAVNLVVSVGIGVLVAVLTFLSRMSRSVVRRALPGDAVHSRRLREPGLMQLLQQHGRKILVLELEGPLFFGTAENLTRRVEAALREDVVWVILDLRRVNEVDSTGAKILLSISDLLVKTQRHLLLSQLDHGSHLYSVLRDMGVVATIGDRHIFLDTDRALEWAEDRLIESEADAPDATGECRPEDLAILGGLSPGEWTILRGVMARREYEDGAVVFREGDDGAELFVIAGGTASANLRPTANRTLRLATFSAGTVFGEIALLDEGTRSATIEAEGRLVCYVLTRTGFDRIVHEHPTIAVKLLANLGRELSQRLRRANRAIYQLDS
jgi:MFS superfamily sulfate permease-like transporter